ncbi:hypothetical protein VNI00_004582 [Paramarasmius palmivorus]|uniref:F-box domain-containing protein n=1 Tax=Paramarasmius palmivorus TaxID=297713 RepID=A0AAW0DIA4_9AGAR
MDSIVLCNKCQHAFFDTQIHPFPDTPIDALRSNRFLSVAETHQEKLELELRRRVLEQCDQEIARLEKVVQQLKTQRSVLAERIERHSSLISPIRRLPIEILEEIFELVCHDDDGYGLDTTSAAMCSKVTFAPTLYLTHVSCHWRRVASASTRLWSSIRIYRHLPFDVLRHYLAMSKEYPLNIVLSNCQAEGVFSVLYPHLPRIKQLNFQYAFDAFDELDIKEPLSFASLRVLEWDDTNLNHDDLPDWLPATLRKAPRLTRVKIGYLPNQDSLPYHQLTVLEIAWIKDWNRLVTILRLCTNLQTLEVIVSGRAEYEVDLDVHAELTTLRFLSIDFDEDADPSCLRSLTLPSLTSVLATTALASAPLEPFTNLVRRSGCRLRDFDLEGPRIGHGSTAEFREFFSVCPELQELYLSAVDADAAEETLAHKLFDTHDSQDILPPNLNYIQVSETRNSIRNDTMLGLLSKVEVWNELRHRRGGASKDVKELVLSVGPHNHRLDWPTREMEDTWSRVEKLEEAGVICDFEVPELIDK